ncbi:MAG TPA: type I-U CRISPR-associated helicase/endonuclease Cas3, partial [Kofleriaceae bacterium]|nr:type I-U CRISPR-associated helicase/endonuclease Cas3 [Kofleriaceae bacterium]
MPSFEALFSALHGRAPFPWQRRLADQVLHHGWPEVLDLPTGVGKTSALDVALYCLAAAPARMPRRIVLVVDRRIVVDQGAAHARAIRDALTAATEGPVAVVAGQLRALWEGPPGEAPVAIAVMRGGMPRDNDWARRPDQPLLGVSTVDQVGSRLLFRGYGVSPRSASLHAGLLGNDTLILLDEVHLANAFAQTLDAIRTRFRSAPRRLPDRFLVVQMSATVRAQPTAARVFGLADEDRSHPTLANRLGASKRASLRTIKVTGDDEARKREAVAAHAVKEAIALQAQGARVIAIVVNRVDTARIARRLLDVHGETTDAILITGRMRPLERDHVVEAELVPRAGAGRARSDAQRPLIVVATQCIEAGADLDFDAIVTECASLDALRQRFGRVDRRGELHQSRSTILVRSDQIAADHDDPVYGRSLGATWRWLVEQSTDDEIDLGVSALPPALDADGRPRLDLLARAVDAPVLLPSHLDAWTQTSQRLQADPDPAMWLHGPERSSADVQIIWRASAAVTADDPGPVIDRLMACRPSTLEAVAVPLAAARAWLDDRAATAVADVEVTADAAVPPRAGRLESAQRVVGLRWAGDDSVAIRSSELRPGDVLIVDVARGGLAQSSFDPASTDVVRDLGDLAQLRARARATLRLEREA